MVTDTMKIFSQIAGYLHDEFMNKVILISGIGLVFALDSFLIGAYMGMYLESTKMGYFISPDSRQILFMSYLSILLGFLMFVVGSFLVNRILSNTIRLLAIIWMILVYKDLLSEGYHRLIEERFIFWEVFVIEIISFVVTIACLIAVLIVTYLKRASLSSGHSSNS